MAEITLLISGLVPPRGWPHGMPRLSSLEKITRCGRATIFSHGAVDQWLLDHFGLAAVSPAPIAPYSLIGDGLSPRDAFWLHADPVNLSFHRNDCVLMPVSQFEPGEADALLHALNDHFHADGLLFVKSASQRWYVRATNAFDLVTTATSEVSGRPISLFQPSGSDAQRWSRIANDAQMMLHAHPVNAAREARAGAPINGLWFWGGGVLHPTATRFDAVYTNDKLCRGLAASSGISVHAARDFPSKLRRETNALLVNRDAATARASGDRDAWNQSLEVMHVSFLEPALLALREGTLTAINLVTDGANQMHEWALNRADLWRIWRSRSKFFDLS